MNTSSPSSDNPINLRATTVRLDAELDPLVVGTNSGLLWKRGQFVLAGDGEAARIPVERPGGSASATAMLQGLIGSSEVQCPGAGPVAFASFPFDPTVAGELIVPEVVIGQDADGRRWLTLVSERDDPVEVPEVVERLSTRLDPPTDLVPQSLTIRSKLPAGQWRDEIVGKGKDAILAGELQKVVLSRSLTVTTDSPIDSAAVVRRLIGSFPTAIIFRVGEFMGASPELLVARRGDIVRAHPLAGTAARAATPTEDGRRVAALLASTKDRWEHSITIEWLLKALLPFCSYVDAEPEPSVVSLENVHHLGTLVEGRLRSPNPSVLDLVSALHPTPAVGGDPQSAALRLITELEGGSRGRYAGPTGWVDAEGNGAFAVAIRSATIRGSGAELRAGVGVVADSDPAQELEETRNKFQAMLSALVRP